MVIWDFVEKKLLYFCFFLHDLFFAKKIIFPWYVKG